MSENVATQDLNTVKDMSCDLEMGELRKISTLQDIPLADGVSMQESKTSEQKSEEENERKIKTNSLKRFFRLSPKKKFEDGSLETDKNEVEFEEENVAGAEAGHHKESGHKTTGHKDLSNSFSKASIKSSLNTYWNSVFKQKKSRKSSKSQIELQSNANEASSSVNAVESRLPLPTDELQESFSTSVDDIAIEEVQSLQISEEAAPK